MFRALGRFTNWLMRGGGHQSVADGIAATSVGETFSVDTEFTTFSGPLGASSGVATILDTVACTAISADGEYLWIKFGASIEQLSLADTGIPNATPVDTFVPTNSGTVDKIVTNSRYVAFIQADRYLEVFDKATLTSQFTYDHGAAVALRDVAITETHIAICGEARAGDSATIVIFDTAGTETGTHAWTSECYGITNCWKQFVFKGGNGGTGANKQLARISIGGSIVWEVTPATAMGAAEYQNIACNGRVVVTHNGPGDPALSAYSCGDGSLVWELDAATNADMVTIDAKNVYVASATEEIYIHDARNGAVIDVIDAATDTTRNLIAADHRFIFSTFYVSGTPAGGVNHYPTDLAHRRWLRTDHNYISAFPGKASPEVL